MSAPRWTPPIELSKREERVMRRLTRHRKLFGFLRLQRHAIFDEAFQAELGAIYRDTGEGKAPLPPALLAMATVMQAYAGVSDLEAVELATFDARWQMVLGMLGEDEPPFSQGALHAFRERLIKNDLDRRLLERTIEFARATKGFDPKKLPKQLRVAVDSRPLSGAGRVEDTVNLLGRAGRQLLLCAAAIAGVKPDVLADEIGSSLLLDSSIKAALDVDWTDAEQKADAMEHLLDAIESLETFVRERLPDYAGAPPLAEHLATLARLRDQNIDPEPPDGGGPGVRDGVAPDRTVSLSDPDMRHGRKSRSRTFNGYKSHVATDLDDDIILACTVLSANRPEREGFDAMRHDLVRIVRDDRPITEIHADRAYTNAELTRDLVSAGAELLSKPRPVRGKPGLFDKSHFLIDLRRKTATCPDGQTVPIALGEVAHFDARQCGRCPRRADCTTAAEGKGRTLSIAADEPQQRKLAKLAGTSRGRARLRERTAIEHTLARHAGVQGTRARFRGTRKNLFDARRTACVLNLESAHRHYARAA
jgi:hypothetical protein